ncbi:sensor histidine kinase [Mucilaginibacter angelicae]|uniref:histidine kinase n=1 Tax=Mucilaginibacter angelicae TaxID=869718 RepID=A0ABV6L0X1_9SPHI
MVGEDPKSLVVISTLIFLLAPVSILAYVIIYNKKKKDHLIEKEQMRVRFQEELEKTQIEIQEQTLQTVGADLHDNIGQLLSLTSLTLGSIELNEFSIEQTKVNAAIELTGRSIMELRLLGRIIQGTQILEMGLIDAILQELKWIEKSGRFKVNYTFGKISCESAENGKNLIIFRVLQESLNNIIKHSAATLIDIHLTCTNDTMKLIIIDNGKGFDPAIIHEKRSGMGLMHIFKRVSLMEGQLNIQSFPGGGCKIEVLIPYP